MKVLFCREIHYTTLQNFNQWSLVFMFWQHWRVVTLIFLVWMFVKLCTLLLPMLNCHVYLPCLPTVLKGACIEYCAECVSGLDVCGVGVFCSECLVKWVFGTLSVSSWLVLLIPQGGTVKPLVKCLRLQRKEESDENQVIVAEINDHVSTTWWGARKIHCSLSWTSLDASSTGSKRPVQCRVTLFSKEEHNYKSNFRWKWQFKCHVVAMVI